MGLCSKANKGISWKFSVIVRHKQYQHHWLEIKAGALTGIWIVSHFFMVIKMCHNESDNNVLLLKKSFHGTLFKKKHCNKWLYNRLKNRGGGYQSSHHEWAKFIREGVAREFANRCLPARKLIQSNALPKPNICVYVCVYVCVRERACLCVCMLVCVH